MIAKAIFLASLVSTSFALAQNVGVKVDDISSKEDTTITIKKGVSGGGSPVINERKFEIVEGDEELAGDPSPSRSGAQASWKKACDDWKRELRELNRANQILTMSCGRSTCDTVSMGTTCQSKAKYKLKVKMTE